MEDPRRLGSIIAQPKNPPHPTLPQLHSSTPLSTLSPKWQCLQMGWASRCPSQLGWASTSTLPRASPSLFPGTRGHIQGPLTRTPPSKVLSRRGCPADVPCCKHSVTQGNPSPQGTAAGTPIPPQTCAGQGDGLHPTLQLQQGPHIPPTSTRVVLRGAGGSSPRCNCNVTVMLGEDPSPWGSCQCQAWAVAVPGLDTNCICPRKAPNEQQHQGGAQGFGGRPIHFMAVPCSPACCPRVGRGQVGRGQGVPGYGPPPP